MLDTGYWMVQVESTAETCDVASSIQPREVKEFIRRPKSVEFYSSEPALICQNPFGTL